MDMATDMAMDMAMDMEMDMDIMETIQRRACGPKQNGYFSKNNLRAYLPNKQNPIII